MIDGAAYNELREAFIGTAEFDRKIAEAKDPESLIEAVVDKMKHAENRLNVQSKPVSLTEGVEEEL